MKSKIFQEVLEEAPIEMNNIVRRNAEYIKARHQWIKDTQSGKIKYTKGKQIA